MARHQTRWSYIIKVDPDDPWYREEQTLYVDESNISDLTKVA
jgi:hypothetical protein